MQKIIHVLNIKASQEKVFDAIAIAKGLSNWWTKEVKADEKVGGIIDFTFMGYFNPDMKITALNKPTEIRWQCIGGHDLWLENKFSFELMETEGDTQLKFTQEYAKEISDEDYGIYNFNWGYYLQSLQDYCETGTGKPYSPPTG